MFEQLGKYIKDNYSNAGKIVEVGIGHRIDIAIEVKMRLPQTEVMVTDKNENWIRSRQTSKVRAIVDDVRFPSLPLYQGARLIYSLQPPVELVPALVSLAEKTGADLLVAPVSDEQEAFQEKGWRKVSRLGRTVGWLLLHQSSATKSSR